MKLNAVVFLLLIGSTLLFSCNGTKDKMSDSEKNTLAKMAEIEATMNDPEKTGKYSRLVLDMDEHDFGDIQEGEVVSQIFRFKNVGDAPLLIHECSSSCGCTVPNWPKDPIPPGGVGDIEVRFDSKGKTGVQSKSVIIKTNGKPNKEAIVIRANVVKAK